MQTVMVKFAPEEERKIIEGTERMKIHSCYFFATLFCVQTFNSLDATQFAISHTSCLSVRLATIEDLKPIIALDTTISYEYFKPLFLQYPEYEGKERDVEKMLKHFLKHLPVC